MCDALQARGFDAQANSAVLNTHGRSAAGRAALEAYACDGKRSIWDIGGKKARHRLNRRNAWCTQPSATIHDFAPGDCTHTADTCDCCPDPDLILCVHSAYYLSLSTMFMLARKAGIAGAQVLSVEHPFRMDDMAGYMDDAEYTYFYDVNGNLSVKFVGDETYTHNLPKWFLQDGVCGFDGDEALVRSEILTFGDQRLVRYHIVAKELLPPSPAPLS